MHRADPTALARLHALVGPARDGPDGAWAAAPDAPTLRLVAVPRSAGSSAPQAIPAAPAAPAEGPSVRAPSEVPVEVPDVAPVEVPDVAPVEVPDVAPVDWPEHPRPLAWAPPVGPRELLAASVRARVPAALRGGRWDPGRRGVALVGVLGLVAAAVAIAFAVHGRARPVTVAAAPLPPLTAATDDDLLSGPMLQVDVEGRVRHRGVVRLAAGARVAQALAAAGGALPGTDTTGLDLAQKVADGQQLRVGLPGGPVAAGTVGTGSAAGSGSSTGGGSGGGSLVDLNTATADQLDALPHVGPATAAKILAWRSAHGPFTAVSQLQQVSGIGPSTYQDLAPLVTV